MSTLFLGVEETCGERGSRDRERKPQFHPRIIINCCDCSLLKHFRVPPWRHGRCVMMTNRAAVAHEAEHTNVAFAFARDGSFRARCDERCQLAAPCGSNRSSPWKAASRVRLHRAAAPTRNATIACEPHIDLRRPHRRLGWMATKCARNRSSNVPPRAETPQDRLQPLGGLSAPWPRVIRRTQQRGTHGMVGDAYPVTVAPRGRPRRNRHDRHGRRVELTLDLAGQFAVLSRREIARDTSVSDTTASFWAAPGLYCSCSACFSCASIAGRSFARWLSSSLHIHPGCG